MSLSKIGVTGRGVPDTEDHRAAISNRMAVGVTISGTGEEATAAAATEAAEALAVSAAEEAEVGRLGSREAAPPPGLTQLLRWTETGDERHI